MIRITQKKILRYILLPNVCLFTALAIYFPGAQLPIALTLATGIQGSALQAQIDHCEAKAIEGADFTAEEITFLQNLYTCLYKGARLTVVLPEVSKMMEHYLAQSGASLEVEASIFTTNAKVIHQMETMKAEILSDKPLQPSYRSETFYMPDFSNIDSVFGLYYGHLIAEPERINGSLQIHWRAEVPWEWPSYASLTAKHGDPHAESFPIPNVSCLIKGIDGAIYIDNGLGEHITHLGLAKSFTAFTEWTEVVNHEN
ncbi:MULTISPECIES: hypothetical protein [unclassified Lentimonas]|uniref:hypothetical protein n=1 Tax=unclassified Lentimonas TaxID=2630993 RepID=UPI00132BCB4F|nr:MULTISPECIES: hypothetical protein [unclassified Lentimonas]CAA6689911.1 Unannotated [Lentimonas sp. CC10]CAA6690952.1 Unannotated [Lentimonas sp. CC19]CAA7069397.1 Unannotated [Lentimonas sp. CC11]